MRANYPTFDVMSAAFFYSQLKHPISEFLRPFQILSAKKGVTVVQVRDDKECHQQCALSV